MWHPNPEITALMNQACSMIATKEAAVPILDRVIELEPNYYEVDFAHTCSVHLRQTWDPVYNQ